MEAVQEWVYQTLLNLGLSESTAGKLDNFALLFFIIILATVVNYILRSVGLKTLKRIAEKTRNTWDDLIVETKIINKLLNIVPAILIYVLMPLAFREPENAGMLEFLERMCLIFMIATILRFINSVLNLSLLVFNRKENLKNKPLKGLIQVLQIIVIFIGIILIIGELMNESPMRLIAGLGASAAILSFVFKDTLMGFIAGIQLSANDMLRPGDWITMPKYGADGDVIEVTLNTVKVQNFDHTITTIPPLALINDSFQNWRGMSESGGRRVKRSIHIDMNSVRFCDEKMLDKFSHISLIHEYIEKKKHELKSYNESHDIDASVLVNGRRQTNVGVFRAYLEQYLKHHPRISGKHTCMVRQLQPTDKGLPIELYFFTSTTKWIDYENIQSDVFDHVLAIIPEFNLYVFQNVSGKDMTNLHFTR